MTAGLALALLSLAQLVLIWLTDRATSGIDRAIFAHQVKGYDGLGIEEFFVTHTSGTARRAEVLRLAALGSAARASITALVVTLASLVVTAFVVVSASPPPTLAPARLTACILGAVAAAVALFGLLVKLAKQALKAHAPNEKPQNSRTLSTTLKNYAIRLRCGDVLTPYLTIALLGNLVAIAVTIGL